MTVCESENTFGNDLNKIVIKHAKVTNTTYDRNADYQGENYWERVELLLPEPEDATD